MICIRCDVSKENDVKEAINQTIDKFGTIHVALASAGIIRNTPTLTSKKDLDTKIFQTVIDVNVMGSVYVAKYATIAMTKNKPGPTGERGIILFVGSVASNDGPRGQVAYASSKAAISGLVLPMARDLGRFGIRTVSIAPGIFETPIGYHFPKSLMERRRQDTPMLRFGHSDEFAQFAASIVENTYINGVNLRIDGAIRLSNL